MRLHRAIPRLALLGLPLCLACSGFDKESAAAQIRERFCGEWAYGCTNNTRVQIGKVKKTPNGRSVEFRVIDREDATATLSAAYFEEQGDGWRFLLFEDPFLRRFRALVSELAADRNEVSELLMQMRSAQSWHRSIYGSYAAELDQLARVNYKPPEKPIQLAVAEDGTDWTAEAEGRYVRCTVGAGLLLPGCSVRTAPAAGEPGGPLAKAFEE